MPLTRINPAAANRFTAITRHKKRVYNKWS